MNDSKEWEVLEKVFTFDEADNKLDFYCDKFPYAYIEIVETSFDDFKNSKRVIDTETLYKNNPGLDDFNLPVKEAIVYVDNYGPYILRLENDNYYLMLEKEEYETKDLMYLETILYDWVMCEI